VSEIAKIVSFGNWNPQPNKLAIIKKAEEIEHFFVTTLVAIHALKDNSKFYVIETVFGGDEFEFNNDLLKVAEIQIKDELDDDKAMPENIRRMACEIGKVDWVGDEDFLFEDVLEELEPIINELFHNEQENESLSRLAVLLSEKMGIYFEQVCFSPNVILEAYKERLKNISI
jgi:hypothetical protein